jgi:hypothetical protein
VERSLRVHVETTGSTLPGWDKKETQKPTALMMLTTFAGVLVLTVGAQRHLARPLSAVPQPYLTALGLSMSGFTCPSGERSPEMAGPQLSRLHRSLLRWLAAAHEHPGRVISSSHQVWGRVLPGDTGHSSARLRTLEAGGLIVIERSPGDTAHYRRLTAEGPNMGLEMRIKL